MHFFLDSGTLFRDETEPRVVRGPRGGQFRGVFDEEMKDMKDAFGIINADTKRLMMHGQPRTSEARQRLDGARGRSMKDEDDQLLTSVAGPKRTSCL